MPSGKPATMIDHLMISLRASGEFAAPCAYTGNAAPAITISAVVQKVLLFTTTSSFEILDRRRRVLPGRGFMPMLVVFVFHGHRGLQVNDREQHEDERLQTARDEPEKHHRQRNDERNDAADNQNDQLFAEDVAEQTE